MKRYHTIGCIFLVATAIGGWRIGARLTPDALGVLVGMLFGILAGMPAMLMVLSSRQQQHQQQPQPESAPAPKVVVTPPPQITVNNHYHGDVRPAQPNEIWVDELQWVREVAPHQSGQKQIPTTQKSRHHSTTR